MTNVIKFKRPIRPLRARYDPALPYVVERVDHDSGAISYEVLDMRPDSYRILAICNEMDYEKPMDAKADAELIRDALNYYNRYSTHPRR